MSWRWGQVAILTPSSSLDHSSISFSSWLGVLNRESLRAQSPQSAAGSQFGILSPTDLNRLYPGYIIVSRPPASAVLPLIYTGASFDWRLGRGSIYNNNTGQHFFSKISVTWVFSTILIQLMICRFQIWKRFCSVCSSFHAIWGITFYPFAAK